jgi:hypothetical protein
MFAVECPAHRGRVLIPETRIRALHNTAAGILVTVECWCGAHLTIRTGRAAAAAPPRTSLTAQR